LLKVFFEQAQGNFKTFFNLIIGRIEAILLGSIASEELD
jgi:hypothetical protein